MSQLNTSQQKAVEASSPRSLIVAGPGTGKTYTLIRKIVKVLETTPSSQKLLAITFTNKAADEMTKRLMSLSARLDQVTVATYHRWCLSLLRRFAQESPLPNNFRVATQADIDVLLNELWPNETTRTKVDILEEISYQKSTALIIEPSTHWRQYQKALHAKGLIDLDDIVRETLLLLSANEELLHQVQQGIAHIFVDEYQDSNPVSHALLKLLVNDRMAITAIGDPNQSIYGFRGSMVEIFHRFEEDFKPAKVFYLKDNYRSGANILQASHQVMAAYSRRGVPETTAQLMLEGKLTTHEATTDRAEAEYVAHQIERMVGGLDMLRARQQERLFGDIAILYRLNAQQHALTQALDHLGIPYQVAKKSVTNDQSDDAVLGQVDESVEYDIERVTLMSMHAAKGLEFPVVFIVGCNDRLVPLDLTALKGDPQEERRLFYVAMTRAKEELYLTYAKRRQLFGQTLLLEPSPFILDIKDDLKTIELARRKKAAVVDQQLKLF